jgi:hypothetical protein
MLLIRAGADVEARTPRGFSPLHFAAMGGYTHENNAVDALLKVTCVPCWLSRLSYMVVDLPVTRHCALLTILVG